MLDIENQSTCDTTMGKTYDTERREDNLDGISSYKTKMNSMKIIPSVWKSQSANKVYSSWSKSRHKMSNLNESVKNCNSMARRMTTTLTEAIPDIRQVVIKTLKSMYTFFSETFN